MSTDAPTDVTADTNAVERPLRSPGDLLLDGRRVRVLDLLDAGLLKPGDRLVWERPRLDEAHRATVLNDGQLLLDGGGTYPTPSKLASVAARGGSVDGWLAWTVEHSRHTLDALRRRMLHSQISDTEQSPPTATPLRWLECVRSAADRGAPETLTVAELVRQWDSEERDSSTMDRMDADLENQGLCTRPDYRSVPMEATVTIAKVDVEPPDPRAAQPGASAELITEATVATPPALGVQLKVSRLPSAAKLVSVRPDTALSEVITTMLVEDYSQLAVLSGVRELRGAVSWKSIARAKNVKPDATLGDAVFRSAVVDSGEDLLTILPQVWRDDFVFVRSSTDRSIQGIVTTADVVALYADTATPFFLIGEIDYLLRRVISDRLELSDVQGLCRGASGSTVESFSKMSMGDYCQVLENDEQWRKIGWSLDRRTIMKRLQAVRTIRNKIMHFTPDPPSALEIEQIRQLLAVLREYTG